jgi:bacteriocin-like protein
MMLFDEGRRRRELGKGHPIHPIQHCEKEERLFNRKSSTGRKDNEISQKELQKVVGGNKRIAHQGPIWWASNGLDSPKRESQ